MNALVLSSLVADSLCLGPHWIYDTSKIDCLYPDGIDRLDAPHSDYHPGKSAGDQTHYGDQTLALLASLAHRGNQWTSDDWKRDWSHWASHTTAYLDGATKRTLENLDAGLDIPSDSNDLAGASRIAPLFAVFSGDELITRARNQTALTHGDPQVIDAAEFFARATSAVIAGATIPEAVTQAASHPYDALPASDWIAAARHAADAPDLKQAAAALGLTCHVPDAFPLTIAIALRFADSPMQALTTNAMLGGDSAARALLLGLLFGASHTLAAIPAQLVETLNARQKTETLLTLLGNGNTPKTKRATFPNPLGDQLDAVIDLPTGPVRAYALFAHCFTCGKNLHAATRVARALAAQGIATLRFDFTGLGASGGDFSNTSFLTNLDDLVAAANFLREHHHAPTILIGHSLGGTAVLAAARRIPESKGVVTIAAPSDPTHVTSLFKNDIPAIRRHGHATVTLAGRTFPIGARFVDDLAHHCQPCEIAELQRDLLIFHSPADRTVHIDHAARIFDAAKHPKSFHSLANADHLLTNPADTTHVANIIAAWADRLIG
ncbi:MAG: alpha/beta fold hydrolase [Verrucomicrobiota bacterium JB025]|nr:alpha/beta fold hydrolase [Verrucomicrobiota bacterium JB025]